MTVEEFVKLVRECRELGATRVEAHGFVAVLPSAAPSIHAPRTEPKSTKHLSDEQRFELVLQSELVA
jgi:hypothetical protein